MTNGGVHVESHARSTAASKEMAFTAEFIHVQPVQIKGEDSPGLFAEDCPRCNWPAFASIDMNTVWK